MSLVKKIVGVIGVGLQLEVSRVTWWGVGWHRWGRRRWGARARAEGERREGCGLDDWST